MANAIRGDAELLKKLKRLENLSSLAPIVQAGALHLMGKIKPYPASSAANRPNAQGRWYERGYGPRWMRKDGSMGGKRTSETLGRKWAKRSMKEGLVAVVGNNASYAPYVHDAERQAGFHGERGWKTDRDVIDSEGPYILKEIQKEVDRLLAG